MNRARVKSYAPNGSATESLADRAGEILAKLASECLNPLVERALRKVEPRMTTPLVAAGLFVASAVFLMQAGREALNGAGAPPWLSSLTMALAGVASALALLHHHSGGE